MQVVSQSQSGDLAAPRPLFRRSSDVVGPTLTENKNKLTHPEKNTLSSEPRHKKLRAGSELPVQVSSLEVSPSAYVGYMPNFLSEAEENELLAACTSETVEKELNYRYDCYGKEDRPTAYFADSEACIFEFCELRLVPKPWPSALGKIKDKLNTALKRWIDEGKIDCFNKKMIEEGEWALNYITSCLVNKYNQGQDFIPWHADDVRAHGVCKFVISLSVGGPRPIVLRKLRANSAEVSETVSGVSTADKTNDSSMDVVEEVPILLESGSVFIMAGTAQDELEHSLPLEYKGVLYGSERFSMTMRSIVPGFHRSSS